MQKTIRKAELRWTRVSIVRDEKDVYNRKVNCSRDVFALAERLLEGEVHEVFIAFLLTTKNKVIGYQEIGRGGLSATAIRPADVFRAAIHATASAIIIAHNHPSGESKPSAEDVAFTRRLKRGGELLGVEVLDHIVIGDGENFSFLDAGMMTAE